MNDLYYYCFFALLTFFAYLDMKDSRLRNRYIILAGLFVAILVIERGNYGVSLLAAFFGIAIGLLFWSKHSLGGADVKLLGAVIPAIPFSGLPNMLAMVLFFFIMISLFSVFYWVAFMIAGVKNKELPFIPIILFAYIGTYLFRFG